MTKNIIALIVATVLSSCGQHGPGEPESGRKPLLVTGMYAKDAQLPLPDKFGVRITADTGHYSLSRSGESSWVFDEPIYVSGPGILYAFYPSDLSYPEFQMQNGNDYMRSEPLSYSPQDNRLNIELTHLMSMLNFTVENHTIGKITADNAVVSARCDLSSGAVSAEERSDYSVTESRMMLIPQHLEEVKISIDDREYSYSLPVQDLLPGVVYDINLKLNADRITLEPVSLRIREWQTGNSYNDYI